MDSNPLLEGNTAAVEPHICFILDANKSATRNKRDIGSLEKENLTPILNFIFSFRNVLRRKINITSIQNKIVDWTDKNIFQNCNLKLKSFG